MARVPVTGGSRPAGGFVKWSEAKVGYTLEGVWRGAREGKYGDLGEIKPETGPSVTFPMVYVLEDKLRFVRVGAVVSIVYLGKTENPKTGRSLHEFDIQADEADLIEPDVDEGHSEDVPF